MNDYETYTTAPEGEGKKCGLCRGHGKIFGFTCMKCGGSGRK